MMDRKVVVVIVLFVWPLIDLCMRLVSRLLRCLSPLAPPTRFSACLSPLDNPLTWLHLESLPHA